MFLEYWVTWVYVFSIAVGVSYTILLSFSIWGWTRLEDVHLINKIHKTKASIIIAARNEEEHIEECLEHIVNQDYPSLWFEIIVVDDDSSDATAEIITAFQSRHQEIKIKIIRLKDVPGIKSFKKRAIAEGVKQSEGTLIITTDADCVMGNKWLSSLVSFYESSQSVMIAAPVNFYREKSFFEKAQSLEFAGLMAISGAAMYYHRPLMCNGANLAYEKNAFNEVNGFEGIDNIASGDDVLLMRKIKNKYPRGIHFLKEKEAIVYTRAQTSLRHFFQQRRRWASKSFHMIDGWNLMVATIVFSFNFCILATSLLSAFNYEFMPLFFVLVGIKCLIDFLLLFLAVSFFETKRFIWLFIPVQVFYIFYIVFTGIFSVFGKYQWKGRLELMI